MNPKKVFDVIRHLIANNIIEYSTGALIADRFAEYSIDPRNDRRRKNIARDSAKQVTLTAAENEDNFPVICPQCQQTVLPF